MGFEPSEDPIPVYADKIRIFEVISNFLTNVIKFSNGKSITNSINRVLGNDIDSNHILADNREAKVVDINENPDEAMKTMMMAVVSKRDRGKGNRSRYFSKIIFKVSHNVKPMNCSRVLFSEKHY